MPYKEKEIEKIYYTIGEVAEMFQVNTSHIRFWSNEFDVIKPSTNKKGNRLYTHSDIENLKKIYHLVKEKGFTLKGAKVELKKAATAAKSAPVAEAPKVENQPNLFDQPSAEIRAEETNEVNIVDKIAVLNSLQKMRAALLEAHDQLTSLEENQPK
jgi:DNA-binding transcriptional MerR regulator